MASIVQLRPDEKILFEGGVVLLENAVKEIEGECVVTNLRFVFKYRTPAQEITYEKHEVTSVVEDQTRGFETTLVLHLTDGSSIKLKAINARALNAALSILTGQQKEEHVAHILAPDNKAVRNGTAWLAAFSPLITMLVFILLWILYFAIFSNSDPDNVRTFTKFKLWALELAMIWMFIEIDYLWLQRQGFNLKKMGLDSPGWKFPLYLFKRAKVFGHSMAYAVTWSIFFAIEVILSLSGL